MIENSYLKRIWSIILIISTLYISSCRILRFTFYPSNFNSFAFYLGDLIDIVFVLDLF